MLLALRNRNSGDPEVIQPISQAFLDVNSLRFNAVVRVPAVSK